MEKLSIFLLAVFVLLLIINIIQLNNDIERKNAECIYWREKTLIEKKKLNSTLESSALKDSLYRSIIKGVIVVQQEEK